MTINRNDKELRRLSTIPADRLHLMRLYYKHIREKLDIFVFHMNKNYVKNHQLQKDSMTTSISKEQLEHGVISPESLEVLVCNLILKLRELDSHGSTDQSRHIHNTHSREMDFIQDIERWWMNWTEQGIKEVNRIRHELRNYINQKNFYVDLNNLCLIDHRHLDMPYPWNG